MRRSSTCVDDSATTQVVARHGVPSQVRFQSPSFSQCTQTARNFTATSVL